MHSIAKAFPLTNPQVSTQGDTTASGALPGFSRRCFLVLWLDIEQLMALRSLLYYFSRSLTWNWHNSEHTLFSGYQHNEGASDLLAALLP